MARSLCQPAHYVLFDTAVAVTELGTKNSRQMDGSGSLGLVCVRIVFSRLQDAMGGFPNSWPSNAPRHLVFSNFALGHVGANLEKMLDVIRLTKSPDVPIGPWCSDPYDCPLREICWDFLPGKSVFDLTRIGSKGFDLLEEV